MQKSILQKIEEIDKTIENCLFIKEAAIVLSKKFNDLEYSRSRRANFFISSEVNSLADNCDIYHYESDIIVRPYYIYDKYKAYSNPMEFWVGEDNCGEYGFMPAENWIKSLKNKNISDKVIVIVQAYFDKNPPIDEEYSINE